MKVYFYSTETGLYQGEAFLDERQIDLVEGVTRIAPPTYACGEVPVFDISTQCWDLIKLLGKRRPIGAKNRDGDGLTIEIQLPLEVRSEEK